MSYSHRLQLKRGHCADSTSKWNELYLECIHYRWMREATTEASANNVIVPSRYLEFTFITIGSFGLASTVVNGKKLIRPANFAADNK